MQKLSKLAIVGKIETVLKLSIMFKSNVQKAKVFDELDKRFPT
jgi:hypothetical protein